jgi:hypothetical protein
MVQKFAFQVMDYINLATCSHEPKPWENITSTHVWHPLLKDNDGPYVIQN